MIQSKMTSSSIQLHDISILQSHRFSPGKEIRKQQKSNKQNLFFFFSYCVLKGPLKSQHFAYGATGCLHMLFHLSRGINCLIHCCRTQFFFSFLLLNRSLYFSRKTFCDLLKSYSPIKCLKHHGPFFCRSYYFCCSVA